MPIQSTVVSLEAFSAVVHLGLTNPKTVYRFWLTSHPHASDGLVLHAQSGHGGDDVSFSAQQWSILFKRDKITLCRQCSFISITFAGTDAEINLIEGHFKTLPKMPVLNNVALAPTEKPLFLGSIFNEDPEPSLANMTPYLYAHIKQMQLVLHAQATASVLTSPEVIAAFNALTVQVDELLSKVTACGMEDVLWLENTYALACMFSVQPNIHGPQMASWFDTHPLIVLFKQVATLDFASLSTVQALACVKSLRAQFESQEHVWLIIDASGTRSERTHADMRISIDELDLLIQASQSYLLPGHRSIYGHLGAFIGDVDVLCLVAVPKCFSDKHDMTAALNTSQVDVDIIVQAMKLDPSDILKLVELTQAVRDASIAT